MAANHLSAELQGRPAGPRTNGRDPWREEIQNLMFTAIIKELNRRDIEYGYDRQSRGQAFFTIEESGTLRTFKLRIGETA